MIHPENAAQLVEERIIGDGRLSQVKISPGGGLIAYTSSIGIRLLDRHTLKERGFLESTIPVSSIDFSPDGSLLAAGFENGRVHLYTVADLLDTGTTSIQPLIEIKAHTFLVTSVQFSPNGLMLATSSRDRTANIWNVKDGQRIRALGGFALTVTDIDFSSDNTIIAAGSLDGTMRVWEIKSGTMLNQTGQTEKWRKNELLYPAALLFDPQTGDLISGWGDGSVQTWHWQGKDVQPVHASSGSARIIDLVRQDNQNIVSVDEDGNITTWSLTDKDGITSLKESGSVNLGEGIHSLAVPQDQGAWALGRYPAIIEQYNPSEQRLVKAYRRPGQGNQVTSAVFTQDEHVLISGGGDGILRLWDVDNPITPVEIALDSGTAIQQIVLSKDNRWLGIAVGKRVDVFTQEDILAVYAGNLSRENLHPAVSIPTEETAHRISISPDGSLLAVSALLADSIQIYSIPEGRKLIDLTKFDHPIESLAFSPGTNTLAAGAKDHRVYIWQDLDAGELATLETDTKMDPIYVKGGFVVTSLVWSDQADSMAIAGTFKQARVVNPLDGQVRFYINGALDQLVTTTFSPDGTLLAASGVDGIIRIYGTSDGKQITELKGHSGMVNYLLFSPVGNRLVTCGEDGTIRLWSIPIQ